MSILTIIRRFLANHRLSVVIDPNDNSVTFDPPLVRALRILEQTQAFIHTFTVKRHGRTYFAFALNPPCINPEECFCSEVQIDDQTGDIGYESLCPTVSRICFDYCLPAQAKSRLSVKRLRSKGKGAFDYYIILPPKSAPKSSLIPSNIGVTYEPTQEDIIRQKEMQQMMQRLQQNQKK